MADKVAVTFYMCPKCMEPALSPTPCPKCGGERVTCCPGELNDPCRKPLMAPTGEIRSRAPLWWLHAIGGLDAETMIKLAKHSL